MSTGTQRQQLQARARELMIDAEATRRYVETYTRGRCPDCGHKPADLYETTVVDHARLCPGRGAGYDAAQTEKCDRLRAQLQSLAVLAVRAQDLDPAGDPLGDLLGDIEDDLQRARRLHTALQNDDVFAEVR